VFTKSKSKSDTSPESGGSPMRRKLKKKASNSEKSSPKRSSNAKSTSLTDLTVQKFREDHLISSRHSTSDLSPRSFGKSSSNSSTGTVVPQKFLNPGMYSIPKLKQPFLKDLKMTSE